MKTQINEVSDLEIIDGIKNKDVDILHHVYSKLLPIVKRYIISNSGTVVAAEDIFQDTLIVVYKKVRDDGINLSSSFSTYFIAISKNLWLNQLRRKKSRKTVLSNEMEKFNVFDDTFKPKFESDFTNLFFRHFNRMSSKSQEIIILHFRKIPAREIAIRMGFKNKEYAISRKYKCLKKLISSIKSDPELKRITIDTEKLELF